MVNLFFPYYQCGDSDRQREIDLCLHENIKNEAISKLIVLIDDNSILPFNDDKIKIVYLDSRPTYKKWIELSKELSLTGITILCNSDIYFDKSVSLLKDVINEPQKFLALSRWELTKGKKTLHPNPHWSQDVWAMSCRNTLSKEMLHLLDFPMGVPRCDNKIAYLFSIFGWQIFNPCQKVKSIHVHETEMRTYHKKLDLRIIGGVAYVYPAEEFNKPADLEFDVWVRSSKNIKGVNLNKTLEKWFDEAVKDDTSEVLSLGEDFEIFPANTQALLDAMKSGKSVERMGPNFEMFEYNEHYFFKNAFKLNRTLQSRLTKSSIKNKSKIFAFGIIPPVLDSYVEEISTKAESEHDLNFWQYPCATEKQAYENHLTIEHGKHIDFKNLTINLYLPLPWATYIDRKDFPESYLSKISRLVKNYREIAFQAGFSLSVHSVCQHIHWVRMLPAAKELGITDLHLSHKDSKSEAKQNELGFAFKLHGWPLIAVNYVTPDRSEGMERKPIKDKKLLASFIGAHMPHYLDDSRVRLFEAAKQSGRDDVFVDLGNEWHFNKVVYEEQVLSRQIESHHIDEHHQKTFRYNSILSDSKFSLCPIGAGPNTLRFWESIAVGCIPVVFSDDLDVFYSSSKAQEMIDNCVVWEGDVDESLFDYLAGYDNLRLSKMSATLINCYNYHEKLICWSF